MKQILLTLSLVLLSFTAVAQVPSVDIYDHKGDVFNTSALLEEKTPMIISFWSTICRGWVGTMHWESGPPA